MNFKNTGVMCAILVISEETGAKVIDVGNYFVDPDGNVCVITSKKHAIKYRHKINYPVYTWKNTPCGINGEAK